MNSHLYWIFLLVLTGCTGSRMSIATIPLDAPLAYSVQPAQAWTDLFYRKSGWFGADGIFSIPLDGNDQNTGVEKTLLIFSDTYIGEVQDSRPMEGNAMVNNTVAYQYGTDPDPPHISFHYHQDAEGAPMSFFTPKHSSSGQEQFFWLGDGFVNKSLNNKLCLFAYHVEKTGPNVFDFIEPDVSLLIIPDASHPPFEGQEQMTTPLHVTLKDIGEGNLGSGILVNTAWAGAPYPDGYVYVYGCIGPAKNLVAARVRPKYFDNFAHWRYWNGSTWGRAPGEMTSISQSVSNELSVTPLPDGRYLLIFQVLGISDKVGMRIGTSPIGPFGEIQEIWTTPEYAEGLLPYNAKAHPALSKPGELLVSYNTITLDFWNDIQKDAHIYRPRFIKITFD